MYTMKELEKVGQAIKYLVCVYVTTETDGETEEHLTNSIKCLTDALKSVRLRINHTPKGAEK